MTRTNTFMTEDGYRLRFEDGQWTNGDFTCDCGPDGYPVNAWGEAFSGDFVEDAR